MYAQLFFIYLLFSSKFSITEKLSFVNSENLWVPIITVHARMMCYSKNWSHSYTVGSISELFYGLGVWIADSHPADPGSIPGAGWIHINILLKYQSLKLISTLFGFNCCNVLKNIKNKKIEIFSLKLLKSLNLHLIWLK